MKLSGLATALLLLSVLPTGASRRKDSAVRKFVNLLQELQNDGDGGGGTHNATSMANSAEAMLLDFATTPDVGDVSATLERMEKSLMNTQSDVAASGKDSSRIVAAIKAMQNMLRKDMMPKLLQEHKIAQAALNRLYSSYKRCSRTMTVTTKGMGRLLSARRPIARAMKQCRKTQASRATRAKSCRQIMIASSRAKKATCAAFKSVQQDSRKAWRYCKSRGENWGSFVARIKSWSTRELTKYTTYRTRCTQASRKAARYTKSCTPYIKGAARLKATCDARQVQLETATCTILRQAQSACSKYLPCFKSVQVLFSKSLPDIKKLERGRWAQWRALKRMDCLLGYGCKANKKQIQICQRKSQDIRPLRLRYQRTPTPPKRCKHPTAPTCSSRYVAAYYSGLPTMARAKTCKACEGLSAMLPLPKGFRVRCQHDPAWSYVLDYSDVRSKDDLPSNRDLIIRGFSNKNAFYIGNAKLKRLKIGKAEMCALSSRTRTRNGQCQWSCKRLSSSYWGNARCHRNDCHRMGDNVKKIIAALSGQSSSGWILNQNMNPEVARFQDRYRQIPWNCHRHKGLYAWGVGWHKKGWGVSMRADHTAGSYEVGWHSAHCRWRGNPWNGRPYRSLLDVDTFQIRVELKGGVRPAKRPNRFGIRNFKRRCQHERGWTYVMDYSDRHQTDDIPSNRNTIANGFDNRNAFYIGNRKLNQLNIKQAQICALASRQRKGGKCNWSCKNVVNSNWGGGHLCGPCKKYQRGNIYRLIAGFSGQMTGGLVVKNIKPYIAKFQWQFRGSGWNCRNHQHIASWGVGWHKNGWGISLRGDHGKNSWEVRWYDNTCRLLNKLPVDTIQVRVRER